MDLATVIFLVTFIIFVIIFLFLIVIVFCRDETASYGSNRRSWISWISSPEDESSIYLQDTTASLLMKDSSRTATRGGKKGSNASTHHYFGFGDELPEMESGPIYCPTTNVTRNSSADSVNNNGANNHSSRNNCLFDPGSSG